MSNEVMFRSQFQSISKNISFITPAEALRRISKLYARVQQRLRRLSANLAAHVRQTLRG